MTAHPSSILPNSRGMKRFQPLQATFDIASYTSQWVAPGERLLASSFLLSPGDRREEGREIVILIPRFLISLVVVFSPFQKLGNGLRASARTQINVAVDPAEGVEAAEGNVKE